MNIILGFIKNNLLEVSGNYQNSQWKIIQDISVAQRYAYQQCDLETVWADLRESNSLILKLSTDEDDNFWDEYAILNINTSCEISISSLSELQPTNQILYPADDVIWEELADDISNDWFMIASSQELSQYISIDLNKKRFGFCYDSFIETHATPDESPIIAKSFTELLEKLVSNEKEWFWLDSSFQSYGDAYEDE